MAAPSNTGVAKNPAGSPVGEVKAGSVFQQSVSPPAQNGPSMVRRTVWSVDSVTKMALNRELVPMAGGAPRPEPVTSQLGSTCTPASPAGGSTISIDPQCVPPLAQGRSPVTA